MNVFECWRGDGRWRFRIYSRNGDPRIEQRYRMGVPVKVDVASRSRPQIESAVSVLTVHADIVNVTQQPEKSVIITELSVPCAWKRTLLTSICDVSVSVTVFCCVKYWIVQLRNAVVYTTNMYLINMLWTMSHGINLKPKDAPPVHRMCRGSNWPYRYVVYILLIMKRM
jgi:hypothetical protein